MKRILCALTMLALTQGVCATEEYRGIAEMRRVKGELTTFSNRTLEEKQRILIKALNCYRDAKQDAEFSVSVRLMEPMPEYEGFDQKEKSFTLGSCLEFSGKTMPIKGISPGEMKSLIGYLMTRTAVFIAKAQLALKASRLIPPCDYDETLKDNRHALIFAIHEWNTAYSGYKSGFESGVLSGVLTGFDGETLECHIPRKIYAKNKRKDIKNACIKSGEIFSCHKDCLTKSPNGLCNDICSLNGFLDFSVDELFDFYRTKFIQYDQLRRASMAAVYDNPMTGLQRLETAIGSEMLLRPNVENIEEEIVMPVPPKRNRYNTTKEYLSAKSDYERAMRDYKKYLKANGIDKTPEKPAVPEPKEIKTVDLFDISEPKPASKKPKRNKKAEQRNQQEANPKRASETVETSKKKSYSGEDPFVILPDGRRAVKGFTTPLIETKKPVATTPTTQSQPTVQRSIPSLPEKRIPYITTTKTPQIKTHTTATPKAANVNIPERANNSMQPVSTTPSNTSAGGTSYMNALLNLKESPRIATIVEEEKTEPKSTVPPEKKIPLTFSKNQGGNGMVKNNSNTPSKPVTSILVREKEKPEAPTHVDQNPATSVEEKLPASTPKIETKQEILVSQEPESPTGKTNVDNSTKQNSLRQPTQAIVIPTETFNGTSEEVKKHVINTFGDKVTIHTYTHDRSESDAVVRRLLEENMKLKQMLAQHGTDQK